MRLNDDIGVILTVDIGGRHIRAGRHAISSQLLETRTKPIDLAGGPPATLETVASGAGLVRQLREDGVDVATTADVLALAHAADPNASRAVRKAGLRLGEVLSGVVNFFNPHAVFLTGSLSSSEPFIAAVRSRVYEGCHPLVTRDLVIEAAQTGADAILFGAARLVLDEVSFLPS